MVADARAWGIRTSRFHNAGGPKSERAVACGTRWQRQSMGSVVQPAKGLRVWPWEACLLLVIHSVALPAISAARILPLTHNPGGQGADHGASRSGGVPQEPDGDRIADGAVRQLEPAETEQIIAAPARDVLLHDD